MLLALAWLEGVYQLFDNAETVGVLSELHEVRTGLIKYEVSCVFLLEGREDLVDYMVTIAINREISDFPLHCLSNQCSFFGLVNNVKHGLNSMGPLLVAANLNKMSHNASKD